jgi:hypothetical protein
MADTSATALLEAAKCYACMPPGLWQLIELGLLQQIVGAGTGGGGGLTGAGSPEGAVTANPGTTYYDPATGAFWVKATGTGTNTGWHQLVG